MKVPFKLMFKCGLLTLIRLNTYKFLQLKQPKILLIMPWNEYLWHKAMMILQRFPAIAWKLLTRLHFHRFDKIFNKILGVLETKNERIKSDVVFRVFVLFNWFYLTRNPFLSCGDIEGLFVFWVVCSTENPASSIKRRW